MEREDTGLDRSETYSEPFSYWLKHTRKKLTVRILLEVLEAAQPFESRRNELEHLPCIPSPL
jgi:hypothetical protein